MKLVLQDCPQEDDSHIVDKDRGDRVTTILHLTAWPSGNIWICKCALKFVWTSFPNSNVAMWRMILLLTQRASLTVKANPDFYKFKVLYKREKLVREWSDGTTSRAFKQKKRAFSTFKMWWARRISTKRLQFGKRRRLWRAWRPGLPSSLKGSRGSRASVLDKSFSK